MCCCSEDLMGDSFDTDLLHQTEGTVILHISFAALEQRVIGQEFLKHLKVGGNLFFLLSESLFNVD